MKQVSAAFIALAYATKIKTYSNLELELKKNGISPEIAKVTIKLIAKNHTPVHTVQEVVELAKNVKASAKEIKECNNDLNHTYECGFNKFSLMSDEEKERLTPTIHEPTKSEARILNQGTHKETTKDGETVRKVNSSFLKNSKKVVPNPYGCARVSGQDCAGTTMDTCAKKICTECFQGWEFWDKTKSQDCISLENKPYLTTGCLDLQLSDCTSDDIKDCEKKTCKKCRAGFELDKNNHLCIPVCDAQCKTCDNGVCKKCKDGFRLDKQGQCESHVVAPDDVSSSASNGQPEKKCTFPNEKTADRFLQKFPKGAKSVDWRTKCAVTPVQSQGSCGSCWAFAVTSTAESTQIIKTGSYQDISEQHLVDCDTAFNQGCNGGSVQQGLKYLHMNGGILDSSYPYTGKQQVCKEKALGQKIAFKLDGFYTNTVGKSKQALKEALRSAPVAVAMHVQGDFYAYKSGVYQTHCAKNAEINHGMVAVGYGYDSTSNLEYAIVKNSWGKSWGQQGYIHVALVDEKKYPNGMCGLYSDNYKAYLGDK